MSNYQVKDNHIAAEYDVNGNVITQDEVNERVKSDIKWLKENGTALSPEQVTNLAKVPVLASQLNDTKTKINSNTTSRKIFITFVDDDGRDTIMSRLVPVFTEKNVPCTIALTNSLVDTNGYITTQQALNLQNNYGWEIASHHEVHKGITTVDESQWENELVGSCDRLRARGFKCNNLVWVGGEYNAKAIQIARKRYKCAVTTNNSQIMPPIDSYELGRYDIENKTYDQLKGFVDGAIANNTWLCVMMHSWFETFNDATLQVLRDIIDYIKTKPNVEITTLDKAIDVYGNSIEIGTKADGNGKYFKVSNLGEVDYIEDFKLEKLNKYNATVDVTTLQTGKIVVPLNGSQPTMPDSRPGIYEIENFRNENGYQREIHKEYGNIKTRTRVIKSNGQKGDWFQSLFGYQYDTTLTDIIVPANGFKVVDVPITPLNAGDIVVATPKSDVGNIMFNCTCVYVNQVKLRFYNPTSADITISSRAWSFGVIQNLNVKAN